MRLWLPSPRIRASAALTAIAIAIRELMFEIVFGSAIDWLKENAWLGEIFLSRLGSTIIIAACVFVLVYLGIGWINQRKEPVTILYEGILWVHDGYYPKSDSPRARPECPQHRVPVFFFDNLTGVQSHPRDSDQIAPWAGRIVCVAEGHHTLAISLPAPAIVRFFGQIRQEAETLLGAELRKQGQHKAGSQPQ